jgi:methionine synthase II (cobalamin-independent)
MPQIPFWPQLPKRSLKEGMVAQFSENMPCIKVSQEGIFFDSFNKDKKLEEFYDKVISADLDYFKITSDFAPGLYKFYDELSSGDAISCAQVLKLQVTGPFTFSAAVNDESGAPILHNKVFLQAALKLLGMKALWQADKFKGLGKPLALFIDEPYLGSFGSAYTPLNRQEVVLGLTEFSEFLKPAYDLLGVHCCGNTDWSIFTEVENIDIISFDAFDYLEKFILYAKEVKGFLERKGLICWGIVPTRDFTDKEDLRFLISKLRFGIESLVKKGVSEELIRERLIISPACGLGALTVEEAENRLQLLAEASEFIRKNL